MIKFSTLRWGQLRAGFLLVLSSLGLTTGCRYEYAAPQHELVSASPATQEVIKPMPEPTDTGNIALGFDDPPLVNQQPPEEPRFVQAYSTIGRPRILVFVNRNVTGDLIPVNSHDPVLSVENTQQSSAGIKVGENGSAYRTGSYDYYSHNYNRSFESTGPGKYADRTDIYLQPGQYDEASAKSIDYEMIENILTDWLSASGQVTIISPISARQRLTDQEVQELQNGRPQMLGEVAEKFQAEILVQITARPSRQTEQGLGIRLIAQALNTRGGQQIAQASVDVPPPLEKTTLNRYTRFVARKLMDGMTNSWNVMATLPPAPAASTQSAAH